MYMLPYIHLSSYKVERNVKTSVGGRVEQRVLIESKHGLHVHFSFLSSTPIFQLSSFCLLFCACAELAKKIADARRTVLKCFDTDSNGIYKRD